MKTLGRSVLVSISFGVWMAACSDSSTPDTATDAGSDGASASIDASAPDSATTDSSVPDSAPQDSATTDAGIVKSAVDACQYDSINTTDCAAGKTHYYECLTGGDTLPEPGCVRPTSGTNKAIRWCCPDAFCSVSSTISTICGATLPSKPHGLNCDPATPGVSSCAAQAANNYCCP